MIKTQVQIPEDVYREVKNIIKRKEMSFAEAVRRGLEQFLLIYRHVPEAETEWKLPLLKAGIFNPNFKEEDYKKIIDDEETEHFKKIIGLNDRASDEIS